MEEKVFDFEEPIIIGRSEEYIVDQTSIASPDDLDSHSPIVMYDLGINESKGFI